MLPRVVVIGNLTQDPIVGVTNSGYKYARLNVACSRYSTKTKNRESHFFSVTVWNKTAEFAESYLKKGDGVCIDGELTNRNYTNNEGKLVYQNDINVNSLEVTHYQNKNNRSTNNASEPKLEPLINFGDDAIKTSINPETLVKQSNLVKNHQPLEVDELSSIMDDLFNDEDHH